MENSKLATIEGGITAAKGFMAAGLHCGIKKAKPDLALIWSQVEAAAAGVFTQNLVKAACVTLTQENLSVGYGQAVVVNSGNANACTGEQGLKDALQMAVLAGEALKLAPSKVAVASTGVIGVQLPMDKIGPGISKAAKALSETGGSDAALAIMTTDTAAKETAVSVEIGGVPVIIGGMAKGSGMIHPNMATMLGFITTDAAIAPAMLRKALKQSTDRSFNRITVDGDTSTNDMVVALANGVAGNALIASENEDYCKFMNALQQVCTYLAQRIVRDGEGATKFVEVQVINALSEKDAVLIAKAIAESNLVKTAMFGQDANWGRIIAAAGYSGADFDPLTVNIFLESAAGKEQTTKDGAGLPFDEDNALSILKEKDIKILVDLQQGKEEAIVWTCDLSYDYVRINGEYRS